MDPSPTWFSYKVNALSLVDLPRTEVFTREWIDVHTAIATGENWQDSRAPAADLANVGIVKVEQVLERYRILDEFEIRRSCCPLRQQLELWVLDRSPISFFGYNSNMLRCSFVTRSCAVQSQRAPKSKGLGASRGAP